MRCDGDHRLHLSVSARCDSILVQAVGLLHPCAAALGMPPLLWASPDTWVLPNQLALETELVAGSKDPAQPWQPVP